MTYKDNAKARRKLTDEQAVGIVKDYYCKRMSISEIAKGVNCSVSLVGRITNFQTYQQATASFLGSHQTDCFTRVIRVWPNTGEIVKDMNPKTLFKKFMVACKGILGGFKFCVFLGPNGKLAMGSDKAYIVLTEELMLNPFIACIKFLRSCAIAEQSQ